MNVEINSSYGISNLDIYGKMNDVNAYILQLQHATSAICMFTRKL